MHKFLRFFVIFFILLTVHSYSQATTLTPGEINFKVNNAGGGTAPLQTIYGGILCLNSESTEAIARVAISKSELDYGPLRPTYRDTLLVFGVDKTEICGKPDYNIDKYPYFVIEDNNYKVNVKKKTIQINDNKTSAAIKSSDVKKMANAKKVTFYFSNVSGELYTVEIPKEIREKWLEISNHDIDYLVEHN